MADTVVKTIENIDQLFSQIVVNGEIHESDRYIPPVVTEHVVTPSSDTQEQTQEEQTNVTAPSQGQDVYGVDLNNVLHNFVDPVVVQALSDEESARQQADSNLRSSIDDEESARRLADSGLQSDINDINALIPPQANVNNQLADKNFVNSSISTNTANFLGTYTSLADIEAIPNPTNNDYAFLETTDQAGNTLYDRYKYSGETQEWLFEYELNNSGFTAEQWATINSGLTSTSVSDAIDALDVAEVGGNGKYIKSIKQENGKIVAEADWLSATGGGVAFIGTRSEYEVAKLIPIGQTGHIPSGSKIIITDESGYIEGEDR